MSLIPPPPSPKEQLLDKVASLQGIGVKNGIEKLWDENTVKMLYRNNHKPPVSQAHADRLMAEEEWYNACLNRDYPWRIQAKTSEASKPWFPEYFVYWFERKRILEEAVNPGGGNPSAPITDFHAAAWQNVGAHKKGISSKINKNELINIHEISQQKIQRLVDLVGEYKRGAADQERRYVRELGDAGERHAHDLDKEKEKYRRKLRDERDTTWNVTTSLQKENYMLKSKLRSLGHATVSDDMGTEIALDDEQQTIQANRIKDLEAEVGKKAVSINSSMDENRSLKAKLGHAEAKIIALEREIDKVREKAGMTVMVKKEESRSLKLEDIQPVEGEKEGGFRGFGKRKREETDSEVEV